MIGETFSFDLDRLFIAAEEIRARYEVAQPFPYVVIDDFLTPAALEAAIAAFPPASASIWDLHDWTIQGHRVSLKKGCNEELEVPVPIRRIMRELDCSLFLRFLSKATGVPLLIPDPTWLGNNLILIEPGGFLNAHADFSNHFQNGLDHRLNLLLYLNPDWQDAWGGQLELWRPGASGPETSIVPIANRCVIFGTTKTTFHGHPSPLRCPLGRSRNCVSVYYYTNGEAGQLADKFRNTAWVRTQAGEVPR